jgi:tetratricopeptide (TPR) repeat protein
MFNVEAFPESFNVYDSLGEAYMNSGDTEKAIINYQKSLELNLENNNAKEMLKKLTGNKKMSKDVYHGKYKNYRKS